MAVIAECINFARLFFVPSLKKHPGNLVSLGTEAQIQSLYPYPHIHLKGWLLLQPMTQTLKQVEIKTM